MKIPYDALPPETLSGLAESFILREGTDYGDEELPMAEKLENLLAQIKQQEVVIVYSELHETVNLMTIQEYRRMQQEGDAGG